MAEETSGVAPEQANSQRLRPRGRRRADQTFDLFAKGKLDYIDKLNESSERERIHTYVTLTKRYRGDHFGFFSKDNGQWVDVSDVGLKKVNVVSPVIRANNKNWMEASVKLEVTPYNTDPEVAGGADIAQAILDKLTERDWTEQLEEMISELAQLSGAYFLYSRYNKNLGPTLRVPKIAKRDISIPGQFVCSKCGATGPRQQAEISGGCPECGAPATLTDDFNSQGLSTPADYDEQRGGDTETVVFTSYEMKVDERNAKGGDLNKCRWIRNNYLVYRNELEEMRPWARLDGKGSDWTEGLKQHRALETSAQTGDNAMGDQDGSGDRDEDLLDFRRYWLDPKAVAGWVAPRDYTLGSEEYGYTFTIKAGQTFEDVFEGKFEGLYIERIGDEIIYLGNEDFRKHWSVGHWQMDATSFWGKAQEDLLDLQEMRIEMVNIFFQAGMMMSLPVLIIDGMMFDGEDFVNEPGRVVRTRKGLQREKPISDYVHQLMPEGPGSFMFPFYELLVQSTDESSGVAPVSVGQGDPNNKTATGQKLLTMRAVGLLVPSQKNKARCKKEWAYQQLELVQKYWTPDRYAPIKSQFGEEWKQADVQAFRNANIREDYRIAYVEGTEIPQSLEDRQVKLMGLLESGLLALPIPLQLKQMLVRMAGIDYDVENYEAEMRVCNARLRRMDKVITLIEGTQGIPWATDQITGGPQLDQFQRPVIDPEAIAQVLYSPGAEVIPESDNLAVHMEFWKDQLMAEAAKEMPDPFRIAVLRARILEQADAGAYAQNLGNQLAVKAAAPMAEADAQSKDAEMQRQEESKDNDAARQVVAAEAQGPQGPPTVSAPSLNNATA